MKHLLTAFLATTSIIAAKPSKPNIIVVMADDMGYECVGANGAEDYKTPHLDKMAATGMRFTNCFANPLCTPSRVKIMTGMYNSRNYVKFRVLERNQKTFAHYLKGSGYRTCVTGKWQLGNQKDSAQHFGFEQSLLWQHTRGARRKGSNIDSRHVNPRFERNGEPVNYDNGEFSSDLCIKFILEFMKQHKDEPMFIYYPMILPHCPFVPTPRTPDFNPKSLGSPTYKGEVKYFKDMVNHIDQMMARLEKHLNELGIADNTVIIFTSDNGTDKPIDTKWNGTSIKAGKGQMNDNGTRVPLIIKYPGKIKPKVSDELVDFSDILPTVCDLAGVKVAENIDGVSLWPFLQGKARNKKHAYIWYEKATGKASKATVIVRSKTHLLLREGIRGELQLMNCETPYQLKPIPAKNQTAADKQALKELTKTLLENDKLDRSALK